MGENIAKEKQTAKASVKEPTDTKQKVALEIAVPEAADLVVCKVCGHQNDKTAGLCVMCSNYLFD